MNRCNNPDHPHCTVWVTPGAAACAHGHAQVAAMPAPVTAAMDAVGVEAPESSFDMISRLRTARTDAADAAGDDAIAPPAPRPHVHVSGFDPRAAGGRQTIKLELRDMPDDAPVELTLQVVTSRRRCGASPIVT